jgi:hypothetical protein
MPIDFEDDQNLPDREAEAKQAPTPEAFERLGDAHIAKGRIETAIARYRKAIALTSNGHIAADTRAKHSTPSFSTAAKSSKPHVAPRRTSPSASCTGATVKSKRP